MSAEQRREQRSSPWGITGGSLFHPETGMHLRVKKLRDISEHGVGLQVDNFLHHGESVAVGLSHEGALVQRSGIVAWCVPVIEEMVESLKPNSFIMGIALH